MTNEAKIIRDGKIHNAKVKFSENTFCPMFGGRCNPKCVCLYTPWEEGILMPYCGNIALHGEE